MDWGNLIIAALAGGGIVGGIVKIIDNWLARRAKRPTEERKDMQAVMDELWKIKQEKDQRINDLEARIKNQERKHVTDSAIMAQCVKSLNDKDAQLQGMLLRLERLDIDLTTEREFRQEEERKCRDEIEELRACIATATVEREDLRRRIGLLDKMGGALDDLNEAK